jgi:hypothetical protein
MSRGYISHLRGGDPITFANKKEMGVKPKGLLFTKIIQCTMDNFQKETYLESLKIIDDSLDRKSEAVANFVFPGLDEDKKKLVGLYGREGLNTLKNQLKNHHEKINNLIAKDIYGIDKYNEEFISFNEQTKNITGAILKKKYLSKFSTKFHRAYLDLEENIFYNKNNNESRTSFIYSNLVKIGIEIYQEILIQNGWFEYNEIKSNYQIKDNSICYFCGNTYSDHENNSNDIPKHDFSPATFVVVTGNSNEETAEIIPENKQKILSTVFNNINNKDGNIIKIVLGSKVMNEGISLKNVKSVHILDVYFNFGRVDQVVARAIRWCSHYSLMNKDNMYPEVKLFKYAITLGNNELSTEENLYYKAEQKYLLIKKVERGLKEVAIDCALFKEGNIFTDEIKEFDKCIKPNDSLLDVVITEDNNKYNICPGKCDFTECEYKCDDKLLITKYYDPERNIYKKLSKNELDYSTFTNNLAKNEINYAKNKIKELYMTGYVYNLNTIIDYVKESYDKDKKDLFDNFFVEKALDELIPITENDFNNYRDIIYDKSHRSGYLIYLDGYYIYQPFDENENVPMYYRTHNQYNLLSKLSLYNYIQNEKKDIGFNINTTNELNNINENMYNFDDVIDYYDNRKEFKFIGIIDKEINRGKTKRPDEVQDVFKIREKRDKILEKKRGTGIPSLKGAVCATSKQKEYLEDIAKSIGITIKNKDITRQELCEEIKTKLIEQEKYSKGKDKMTYIMVPINHKTLKFPLNLEDRSVYLQNKINQLLATNIKFVIKENKNSINLSFTTDNKISKNDIQKLNDEGWETKDNKKWSVLID